MQLSALTLSDWTAVIQAAGAIFTAVGVVTSLYLSTRALREVQLDRRHRQMPHLQFERGGYRYSIKFVKAGKRIPGIAPRAVERMFPPLPDDAESVHIDSTNKENGAREIPSIGKLKNFGLGPALSAHVTWVPHRVFVQSESFEIDAQKLREPVYCASLNTMPCVPAHIPPGEQASLTRLPTFIDKDIHRKLSQVDGVLVISAHDVFGQVHEFKQEFTIFMKYTDPQPTFHVTFGDLLPDAAA